MFDSTDTSTAPSRGEPPPDDLATQFWKLWQQGKEPDPRKFLARPKPATLAEILAVFRVDQRERWLRHQPVRAETYLQWCPGLANDPEAALELVYGEYVLREELGQTPALTEYTQRFPQYAARLQQQVELHRALADGDETGFRAPQLSSSLTLAPRTAGPAGPPRVAGYEILEELGRGGMGVVYKARHLQLKRLVALKMILAGGHAGVEQLARFRSEAEAVARLQHPQIVQIYEVGEQEGRPYIALEFLDGGSLADKLTGTPLPPREAAQLVQTLARAVQAAHQQNIIHRDLKPANILLRRKSATCSEVGFRIADFDYKVTDFGLAKQTDSLNGQTQEGAVVGTPSYMAPEQAAGKIKEVGPAADIYALGSILYETLTGRPPFRATTALDTLFQVVSEEPVPPSRLQPRVPRDLETICLKCLRKDPGKRYASALELAEDLRRFEANEPIRARPAGKLERTVKWARRHPGVALLTTLLVVVFTAAFLLVTWEWREAARAGEADREAKIKADLAAQEAGKRADAEKVAVEKALLAARESARREEVERQARERSQQLGFTAQLWRAAGLIDRDPVAALQALDDRRFCPLELRDFPWRYYHQQSRRLERRPAQLEGGLHTAAVSADGTLLAAVTAKEEIRLWDLVTGQAGATLPGHGGRFQPLAFSPDGKTLATGGADGLVKLWEMPAGKLAATLAWRLPDKGPRRVMALAFHPDGRTLAAGGGFHDLEKARTESDSQWRKPVVWLWDVPGRTGKLFVSPPRLTAFRIEDNGVNSLTYSPDGKTLAVGLTRASAVILFDVESGQEQQRFHTEPGWIGGLAFSPDGKALAYGNSTSNVFLCDLAARKVRHALNGHLAHVNKVVFGADGTLFSGASDGSVRVWEAGSGQLRTVFRCQSAVHDLCLLQSGKKLLVATSRETQVWSVTLSPELATLRARPGPDGEPGSSAVVFDEEGTGLAVAGQDATVRVWDVAARKVVRNLVGHKGRALAVAFGPAGSDLLATGGEDGNVLLWRLRGAKPAKPLVCRGHAAAVSYLAVTPDGALVISGSLDGTVRLWDASTGELVHTFATEQGEVHGLALTGDGQRLLTGGQRGGLRVWDLKERKLLRTLPAWQDGRIDKLAMTSDGQRAASIRAGMVIFHDPQGKGKTRPAGIRDAWSVAFTADGKTLAVGSSDRVVRLYNLASGQLQCELPGHSHHVVALAFNRDGTLLTSAARGTLRWDPTGEVKLWAAPLPGPDTR